jgi:glycosyltransferase involved in cell wall biosynthesis
MRIDVYTYVHNEERMMPYFIRHYGKYGKITVFDNESSDRTATIAKDAGARVIPVDTGGKHEVSVLQWYMNEGYKGSRGKADWVILAEGDEFFWHFDLHGLLEEYMADGVTVPKVAGFDMVSDHPPGTSGQIYSELKHGFPSPRYCKRGVFRPEIDINFGPGGHDAWPSGNVVESASPEIRMLHYRFLGEDYFAERYEKHRSRRSRESAERKWDIECLEDHRERYRSEVAGKTLIRVVP